MYKSEAPVGNGLSARIHQLNDGSRSSSSNVRRSQSFLTRSPPVSASTLVGGGGSTTHNNNQPFSYINGNNDFNRNPPNYYSLDRRPVTSKPAAGTVTNTKDSPIIYSQVLPKDQRPKKQQYPTNNQSHHSTMTTTIGDDRHIHHYVYDNPNTENRSKFTKSHLNHNHDLRSHRPTTRSNVTKVFINGDNSYSGTDEQDDDILTPFSTRFSSMPRKTTVNGNGYHNGYNGDLNSSGNTTTTTSTSYYNTNSNSNRYKDDYMNRGNGNHFDSSLSSREASPSPPYYSSQNHSSQHDRHTTRAAHLVRDAERQRERDEYTVPSAKLVRTYMFHQNGNSNGNGVDDVDEDYEISDPIPINKTRNYTNSYRDDSDTQFIVQNRARRTNNSSTNNAGHSNGLSSYKYSYMDEPELGHDTGHKYEKRTTLKSASNGNIRSNSKYGENLGSTTHTTRFSHQSSPHVSDQNRGVLKTSTIRKLTTPASNGSAYRAKSESLLVPERRQVIGTGTLKPSSQPPKSAPSTGNNFLSTLMRSKKSKSTANVAKENGGTLRPENGKPPPGTKHRGNLLAILLRKATSSKDAKNKPKGKTSSTISGSNGTHTLKKASSIPKIITDSEIEEVERRRDSGAYYSWSASDLYGNRDNSHIYSSHSQSVDLGHESTSNEDEHEHDTKTTNRPEFQHNVRFTTIDPLDQLDEPNPPTSSDYYWSKKENSGYNYDDMSDYRRELATTSKPIQPMTNTNSLKKTVTLGRLPNKGPGGTNGKSNLTSTSYYPSNAMSLDRRLLNKKAPKIVVTDDNGAPYLNNSNPKAKPPSRSMSFFSLRPKPQSDMNQGAAEANKKWNFGFMNKSKRTVPLKTAGSRASETSFRYFGDTDVEDLPNRNRNVLRNPQARNRRVMYSEDDDASRMSKNNGMYLDATTNGNGSSSNASPYLTKRDGTLLRTEKSQRYGPTLLPGASSATESEAELQTETLQTSSNGATVFLHAPTIAEIPAASPSPLHERAMSRDELSTIHSGTGSQIETHKLSRSVSVLAPWRPRPKHREGSEINYNSSDGMRSDYNKKPPRPYSLANRSTSSTSISPTDYGKGRNGYGDWKKSRNGSVNSSDSLKLPKYHPHRTSSPSLLMPPPPSGPKRNRPPPPTTLGGPSQKSVTLSRSKSMVDSTGDRNPRSKSGWSPFRR